MDWFLILVVSAVVGGTISYFMSATRLSRAKAMGRLQGRMDMVSSLIEGGKRGMTLEEWLTSEIERDTTALLAMLTPKERSEMQVWLNRPAGPPQGPK